MDSFPCIQLNKVLYNSARIQLSKYTQQVGSAAGLQLNKDINNSAIYDSTRTFTSQQVYNGQVCNSANSSADSTILYYTAGSPSGKQSSGQLSKHLYNLQNK